MPANSRNLAADSFNAIVNAAGHKAAQATTKFVEAAKSLYLDPYESGRIDYDESIVDAVHIAAGMAGH
ncbi:MAG: hypothetical protein MJ195_03210 [Mycoplasmoidaceae bacterium]|nr:hypothetical protein [Mycoplasmoidaceae bacterium]